MRNSGHQGKESSDCEFGKLDKRKLGNWGIGKSGNGKRGMGKTQIHGFQIEVQSK